MNSNKRTLEIFCKLLKGSRISVDALTQDYECNKRTIQRDLTTIKNSAVVVDKKLIHDQKMNEYLKEIASLCGINKRLTTHCGRHSFGTIMLTKGVSIESVSKMLGHTNTRMTAHYAKLIDKCIGEQMDKLMDTFTGASDY